jgi:DNA-binding CsgD family transcriptional regulator
MPTGRLTAREEQIVTLVAHGAHNIGIAAALGISPLTVGTHLRHIYIKLGVHTRAAMVAHVMRTGKLRFNS